MREYRENPATKEQLSPMDLLRDPERFTNAERKAFLSMSGQEVIYLRDECFIEKYIEHLRKGASGKAIGTDFPILVVKGTKLQLERFKMVFLLSLIDYKGIKVYHPIDFALGNEALEEVQKFEGVAIIKIPFGSSTTENFDQFRSDLISNILTARRENFNPTLVLSEQSIAGSLNTTCGLIRVIELDSKKLRGSYTGLVEKVDTKIASRENKPVKTFTQPVQRTVTPVHTYNNEERTSWNSYNKKKSKGVNVNDLGNALEQYNEKEE